MALTSFFILRSAHIMTIKTLHNKLRLEQIFLIVNPKALFQTKAVQNAIVGALKAFTLDRLSMIPLQEDEDDDTGTSHSPRQGASQNQ
jgi:hypothetical protein